MSLNKLLLIGNLTTDATVRDAAGQKLASFSVATSERYKDRSGQVKENTEYHNCELWGMENVHQYLLKGVQVYVEGSVRTDKWQDNAGQQRESKKVRVTSLQLLSGSRQGQGAQQRNQERVQQPAGQQPQQYRQPQPQNQGGYQLTGSNSSFPQSQRVSEDLPF